MIRRIALALALWCLALAPAHAADDLPLTGFYAGGWGIPGIFNYVQIEITASGGEGLKATLWEPYGRVGKLEIPTVEAKGKRIRFAAGGISYDLTRTALGYSGVMVGMHTKVPASFVLRPGSPKPEVLAGYEGTYDLHDGRTLSLSRNNASSGFWWLELPSGRTGYMYNRDDARFVAGRCFQCVQPLAWDIEMVRDLDGRASGVRINEPTRSYVAARMMDVREEPVTFAGADGVKLEGTVFLPAGQGPHPGIVLVHGSGAQSRNGFYGQMRFLAEAYARAGIAVLSYDKRGVGGSAGDWERAGLETLAQDAAAAVKALRARPDIDTRRVGLSGSSQAGWIIPLAARHVPDVALMQIRSGSSPMGVEESEWRRVVVQMKAEMFPPTQAQIDQILAVRHMMDAYAKTGQGWDELEAAFKPVENTVWAERYIGGLPAKDAPDWAWLKEAFTVDTTADFARYKGPIQVLYGGVDFVPVAEARPMLEAALGTHAKDPDVAVAVWPGANHNGYAAFSAAEREFPGLSRYVEGYFPCITEWAAEQFGLKAKGAATGTCPKDSEGKA